MNKISLSSFVGLACLGLVTAMSQGCADKTSTTPGGKLVGEDAQTPTQDSGSGNPGVLSAQTALGKPCLADHDCGGALTCVLSTSNDFLGGGPPNGICTLDCTADFTSPADAGVHLCDKIASDAICLGTSPSATLQGKAFCVPPCTLGSSTGVKCQNRLDMVCEPLAIGDTHGFCTPRCRNDSDCGDRKCDLKQGVCMDASAISGLPIGAACTASGDDPCAGFCFPLDVSTDAGLHGPGFCSADCRLGVVGCGATSSNPNAACLFGSHSQGDFGECAPLCNCNDTCVKGLVCRPFSSAAERTAYGTKGYCGDPIDNQTGAAAANIKCPVTTDAGGGAVDSGGSTDGATPTDAASGADAR